MTPHLGPPQTLPFISFELERAELAGTDEEGRNKKGCGESEVEQRIGTGMSAVGGAGEVEAGNATHWADIPRSGEKALEGLACTGGNAQEKSERREKQRAGEPREQRREVSGDHEADGRARSNDNGNERAREKTSEELPRENSGTREKQRTSVEPRFARAHGGPSKHAPHPRAGEDGAARDFEWRKALSDQQTDGDGVPPPAQAEDSEAKFGGEDTTQGTMACRRS